MVLNRVSDKGSSGLDTPMGKPCKFAMSVHCKMWIPVLVRCQDAKPQQIEWETESLSVQLAWSPRHCPGVTICAAKIQN